MDIDDPVPSSDINDNDNRENPIIYDNLVFEQLVTYLTWKYKFGKKKRHLITIQIFK